MLTELRIENFAIIHRLELEFGPGLITLTGETGAGKSIILDALEALLGGRADTTAIRAGSERASVEGSFRIPEAVRPSIMAILEREELLDDPNYLVLERDVRREGRNAARINGRSASLGLLRELGAYLVDIHGQSEHLSLLNVHTHLALLDRYAADEPQLDAYAEAYRKFQAVRKELEALRQAEQDAARRTDLLNYQVQEIDTAHLRPGEDEDLRQERNRLANAESLARLAQESLLALDEGTPEAPSVSDLLGQVTQNLAALVRIDPSSADVSEQAELAFDSLAEIARDLRDYLERIEFNPHRLEQIEERLDLLQNLKRKYGGSLEAVLGFAESARQQLDTIAHAGERIEELQAQEARWLDLLSHQAEDLSQRRRAAAESLARAIEAELDDLKMSGARFSVDFQTRPDNDGLLIGGRRLAFDATGIDRVEFLIAPNPGEGLKPLARTASGGETSRLMLALKNVLARADYVPTLIFDEVDQGIGGRVGMVVGQKLWRLAREHQVFVVTHLPQLAAFGDQHLRVVKQVKDGRTSTLVEPLQGQSRREELAQMLGGLTEGTLRSADEILAAAKQVAES